MEITLYEIWVLLSKIMEFMETDSDGIPAETLEVINSFADEKSNNDIETSLEDIKNALMYDEEQT